MQCVQDVAARPKLPIVVLVDLGMGQDQEPLTLTLSRRERGLTARGFKNTNNQLPLPPGEGWGEGLFNNPPFPGPAP